MCVQYAPTDDAAACIRATNGRAAERRRPSPRYIRRRRSFTLPSVFVPALVSCNTVRIIFRRGRVCVNSRPRDPPRLDQPRPSPSLSPLAFAFPPSHPSLSFLSTALHLSLSLSAPLCFSVDWEDETTGRRESSGPRGAERSTGNESFEIVNFRAWFMHTRSVHVPTHHRTLGPLYRNLEREGGEG